jgi:hypothetical protein
MEAIVFVYSNGKEIKVLNINEANRMQNALIKDGWVHTHTLDASCYIQYLHNDCFDLTKEIKSLAFKKTDNNN